MQENWGKCLYCGADLKAEKEKLNAQRQAADLGETVIPRSPGDEAHSAAPTAVPAPDTTVLPPPLTAPEPVIKSQSVETKPYEPDPIPPPVQRPSAKKKKQPVDGW